MNQRLNWLEIVNSYKEGNSTTEVGTKYGCVASQVSYILRMTHTPIRSISEAKILKWAKQPLSIKERAGRSRARRLMQVKLGRKLEYTEHVHHEDNNPLNNPKLFDEGTPNLKVLSQKEHGRLTHWGRGNAGVTWHKAAGKWRARVIVDHKEHHLGLFTSKEEAEQVCQEYRKKIEATW